MTNITSIRGDFVQPELIETDNLKVAQWLHDTAERVAKGEHGDVEHAIVIFTERQDGNVEAYSAAEIRRDQCIGILEMIKLKTAL